MSKPAAKVIGEMWEFESDEPVEIERPDGSTARVSPVNGVVSHVIDLPGDYKAGTHLATADQ